MSLSFRDCPRRGLSRLSFLLLVLAPALFVPHISFALEDPNRRDEYGLKPKDGSDQELKLPDPRLDRGWPGPKPGEQRKAPPPIAPDEQDLDPLREEHEVEPPKPPTRLPAPKPYVVPPVEKPPAKPPIPSPDGRPDAGSPAEEADPELPDVLKDEPPEEAEIPEPDPSDLSDVEREELEQREFEREETEPSPLEEDDAEFEEELGDPGEW